MAGKLQIEAWRSVFAVGDKCRFRLPDSSPLNPGWFTIWRLNVRKCAVYSYFEQYAPGRRCGILTVVDSRPIWF